MGVPRGRHPAPLGASGEQRWCVRTGPGAQHGEAVVTGGGAAGAGARCRPSLSSGVGRACQGVDDHMGAARDRHAGWESVGSGAGATAAAGPGVSSASPAEGAWIVVEAAPWGVVDAVPEGPRGDDQPKVQGDGAVAPLTGRTRSQISPELGRTALAPCRPPLLPDAPGTRLLVIHDRAGPPTGAPVQAMARDAGGRLILTPQPADSPELNPHERSGKGWRRVVTHHHGLATVTEPGAAVRNVFRSVAGGTNQVRHLCGLQTPESLVASL